LPDARGKGAQTRRAPGGSATKEGATSIRPCQPASPVLRSAAAAPRRQRRIDVARVHQGLRRLNPARWGRICPSKTLVAKRLNRAEASMGAEGHPLSGREAPLTPSTVQASAGPSSRDV
jgi:hypothetical protein